MMDQQHPNAAPPARASKGASARKATREANLTDLAAATLAATKPTVPDASAAIPTQRTVVTTGWHDLSEEVYHADPCPSPSLSSRAAQHPRARTVRHADLEHVVAGIDLGDRDTFQCDSEIASLTVEEVQHR